MGGRDERNNVYVGQVRYEFVDGWVQVSGGATLAEAASGAADAYHKATDASGQFPIAVRVMRVEATGTRPA
jgi:hypothetical protein